MKQNYIALLISGNIRTFVLKEQILFFQRLMDYLHLRFHHVHTYIVLKIPIENEFELIKSKSGLVHFQELMEILNPVFLYCFHDFIYENGFHGFNSQFKMVDMCMVKAMEKQQAETFTYDIFFRVRPDSCFLISELEIEKKRENKIYTSIKFDSIANDQVFLFNSYVLEHWWIAVVQDILSRPMRTDIFPENSLFECNTEMVHQYFRNWLVRDYDVMHDWNPKEHDLFITNIQDEYIWEHLDNYQTLLVPISQEEFMNGVIEIVEKYHGNMGTFLHFDSFTEKKDIEQMPSLLALLNYAVQKEK